VHTCQICFSDKAGTQFVHLGGCDHTFCKECMEEVQVGVNAAMKALLIFDWDDTLLCSSAIMTRGCNLPPLGPLEEAAAKLLEQAMRHGDVCIVTNASMDWFRQSSEKFLPRLQPILEQILVISARDAHEGSFPGNPTAWKRCAFQQLYASWQRRNAETDTQLVVLGDSMSEIDAAHSLDPPCLKTLKFKQEPSVTDLMGQQGAAAQELESLLRARQRRVELELVQESAKMSSTSKGWRLSSREHSELVVGH